MADPNRNVGRSCPTRARSLVRRYIEERPLEARRLDRDETRALRRRRVPFDQCSELGDGRRFEQRRQQHLATDRSLDAREHSHGIERVAAQLGEVVVDTDVVTTQNVRPDRREGAFELVRRRSLLDDDLARVPLRQGDRCVEPGEPRRRATPPDTRLRSPPMELSTSARHCRGPRPTNRPSPVGLRARRQPSWRPRAPASAPSSWPVRLRRAPTARHRAPETRTRGDQPVQDDETDDGRYHPHEVLRSIVAEDSSLRPAAFQLECDRLHGVHHATARSSSMKDGVTVAAGRSSSVAAPSRDHDRVGRSESFGSFWRRRVSPWWARRLPRCGASLDWRR